MVPWNEPEVKPVVKSIKRSTVKLPLAPENRPSATRNGLDFDNMEDAGCGRGFALSDSSHEDLVTIGGGVESGP